MGSMIGLANLIAQIQQPGIVAPDQRKYSPALPGQQPVVDTRDAPIPAGLPSAPPGYQPQQFDPAEALRASEDATRYALAQGLGILAPDPNRAPLPYDQQKVLDQRIANIKSTLGPGPLEQRYKQQLNEANSARPVHGFKARLAAFGKGLLMGEGIPGAIRGASDPTTMNLRYRLAKMQPLFSSAQQEQGFANSQLGRAKQLGELTGYDPMTGLPTPKYDYQMNYQGPAALQRAATGQQRANDYGRSVSNQNKTRDARVDIARLNSQLRGREKGGTLTAGEIIDIEDQFGIRLPPTYDPQKQEIKIDENGQYVLINKTTAVSTPTGVTSYEVPKLQSRERNADVQAGQREKDYKLRERETQRRERGEKLNIEKQLDKEFPAPKGAFGTAATPQQMEDWNKRREARRVELTPAQIPSTNTTPQKRSLKGLPPDSTVIETRKNPKTGALWHKVRLADGTESWYSSEGK